MKLRLIGLAALAAAAAHAQSPDLNLAPPNVNRVVTAARDGYTIAGLVTHLEGAKAFRYGIALFPGVPGILRITEENGQPRYGQPGNFLIRSRRHWLDDETLLVSIDAPSDQWNFFNQQFRATPRYGADIAALIAEIDRRYGGIGEWTFAGTSEGTVSAFHATRMNPALVKRLILTSSLFVGSRNGPGIASVSWDAIKTPLLWVHHESDLCRFTQYSDARRYAEKTRSPLVTVRGGGPPISEPCEARSFHGYIGMEEQTVKAMRSWVRTGQVPADIGP